MQIQIRTKIETWWSYIDSAVVQIGDQTLELMGGENGPHYWINGLAGKANFADNKVMTSMINKLRHEVSPCFNIHYKSNTSKQHKFRLDLSCKGDALSMEVYKDWVSVNIKAKHAPNFYGASGLMGHYPDGTLVARDGVTIKGDYNDFGKEWQVLEKEPMLFHQVGIIQAKETCAMPSLDAAAGRKRRRRLGESLLSNDAATHACGHVINQEFFDNCVYDVLASNDAEMANAYL